MLKALKIFATAVMLTAMGTAPAAAEVAVDIEGTTLELRLADGRSLAGRDLIGTELTLADPAGVTRRIRIDNALIDPQDSKKERWLFDLKVRDAAGNWSPLCRPGPEGLQFGFPVAGTIKADGSFITSEQRLSFTCTGGAIAKCIRFGYSPWERWQNGEPLLNHFRACVRMLRADYCGNGRSHTRDGTLINFYDRIGIETSEPREALKFEAAWDADGAVCLRKTRISAIAKAADVRAACPLKNIPHCSEAQAMSLPGALIFNESVDQ